MTIIQPYLLSLLLSTSVASGSPQINFETNIVDLGVQYEHGYATGQFTVRNIGDETLNIIKVEPDCSCTSVKANTDVVEPGKFETIPFKIHLTEIHGESSKTISVVSNDPKHPAIQLTIKVDTKPLFRFLPETGSQISLPPETATNIIIKIRRADGAKVNITKVATSDSQITANIDNQSDSEGLSSDLWVRIKKHSPGLFQSAIMIYDDDSVFPACYLPIRGAVLPYISVKPDKLFWGIVSSNSSNGIKSAQARTIVVGCNAPNEKFVVLRASTDLDGVGLKVSPIIPDKEYAVVVSMNDIPKKSMSGQIEVELNFKKQNKISIPLTIDVQEP